MAELQEVPKHQWENARICYNCGTKIGKRYFRPRHHCRQCARSVCAACSPSKLQFQNAKARVCCKCAQRQRQRTGTIAASAAAARGGSTCSPSPCPEIQLSPSSTRYQCMEAPKVSPQSPTAVHEGQAMMVWSDSLKKWCDGCILRCDADTITVSYLYDGRPSKKTIQKKTAPYHLQLPRPESQSSDSTIAPIPFESALPDHIGSRIIKATLPLLARVAVVGVGEGERAHGFTAVFGVGEDLLATDDEGYPTVGEPNMSNMFEGKSMSVFDLEEDTRYVLMAFKEDGAVVIDSRTGAFLAANYIICDIRKGSRRGGARHRSASAVAKQAGTCYVVKCSEDACKRGVADFDVFLGSESDKYDATHLVGKCL